MTASMKQTEIALYLYDYSALMELMLESPESRPFDLFQDYIRKSGRKIDKYDEYYNRMLRVVYIFIKMKIFSIAEDYTLKQKNNFINNDDLDLSFLNGKVTGNIGPWSNKKILQKIRDGFNHSSEGNELYKISMNGKNIEFSFTEPSPIQIKLTKDDISSLTNAIGDVAKTFQFFSFDQPVVSSLKEYIENLKITRHYFPKKVESSTIDSVLQYEADGKYEDAISLAKGIDHTSERDITFTNIQINSVLRRIENMINSGILTLDELKENLRLIIIILLNKELPIPILKLDNYLLDSYFVNMLLPEKKFSYHDMLKIFIQGLKSEEPNPVNKYIDTFDTFRHLVFKSYYSSPEEKIAYADLLFIEYVISNFKPEEEFVRIGHRTFEYRKLRNSLVHGRWHMERDMIVFYDALPNVESEMDYNWHVKLLLTDLYQYCTKLLQSRLEVDNPKKLIRFPLS